MTGKRKSNDYLMSAVRNNKGPRRRLMSKPFPWNTPARWVRLKNYSAVPGFHASHQMTLFANLDSLHRAFADRHYPELRHTVFWSTP